MKEHYDIGVVGCWWGANYGSLLNGYAVYRTLKSLGQSVLMIHKHNAKENDWEICNTHSENFIKKFYPEEDVSPIITFDKLPELNKRCSIFLTGSDQIWNYGINRIFDFVFMLNFADDTKKKISFGTSFGHEDDGTPPDKIAEIARLLQRYDAISVREKSGSNICEKKYGIKSDVVCEPVFCLTKEQYSELAEQSKISVEEPYILTYILDPTSEKREAIQRIGEKKGLKVINVLDGDPRVYEKNYKMLDLPNTMGKIGAEDLMKLYLNAAFVVTDSFHGTCFSIIFEKPFLAIANYRRGVARFNDLLSKYDLLYRLATDKNNILKNEDALKPIDYGKIKTQVENDRFNSIEWLRKAIETPKDKLPSIILPRQNKEFSSDINIKNMHIDIRRCQMVAALLREYGINHIVISSGSRHTELVRFFEYNNCFITHNVVDERSAGFFALGLATKLRTPVAVCCTSGTAASNYLTSMSEAFYQHIPLIYITADRYPHLLNQREDQMVPQENMYGSVCLKSATLIPKDDPNTTAAMRRLICETILEATHNQFGPVHINIPIAFINERPLPVQCYNLSNVHFTQIRRYKLLPDRSTWNSVLDALKKYSRIMIVYGQNYKLSQEDIKAFEVFSKKFNCVFCTDNLSNFIGSKSVNAFNIIKSSRMTPTMLSELEPDVVITMFGANVTPFRNFIVKSKKCYHWDISPSGAAADPYKKLSRIFECTPVQFVKRLSFMAGNLTSDDSYYQSWKKYEILNDKIPEKYCQKYAVYQILDKMPDNSLLHLANSNTVRFACSYKLKDGIEVYCNRGTNGIDGSASSFMGQATVSDEPCYLLIGDLSFFYDMNSLWNKTLSGNIRIVLFNNFSADMLKSRSCEAITYSHHDVAEGWVKSLGFTYLSAKNMEEFNANVERFTSEEDTPMFFEVFT